MYWLLNNEKERGDSLYTFVNSIPLQKVHSQTGQNLDINAKCVFITYYLWENIYICSKLWKTLSLLKSSNTCQNKGSYNKARTLFCNKYFPVKTWK